MKTATTYFGIYNPAGYPINGQVIYPLDNYGIYPAVIMLHGYKGFMDWGFFPYVARCLAEAGYIVYRFDFSLNGIVNPDKMIYDPEKFAKNTVAQELEDAKIIIDFVCLGTKIEGINNDNIESLFDGKIYLLGHSMGSAIAILSSARDERIKKLALWSPISHFERYSNRQIDEWHKKGFLEFKIIGTKQQMKINVSFLNDIEENIDKYSIIDNASRLDVPVLIVQGVQDFTVKTRETDNLAQHIDDNLLELVFIDHTGHTFGASHPFWETNNKLDKVIEKTIEFYNK